MRLSSVLSASSMTSEFKDELDERRRSRDFITPIETLTRAGPVTLRWNEGERGEEVWMVRRRV